MRRFVPFFALLAACDRELIVVPEGGLGDTGPVVNYEEDEPLECEEVTLDILGPEAPVVGDEWVIWLDCDGVRLTGPMVIAFDPVDFATIDENYVTFMYAGTAELHVDSGRKDFDQFVTVDVAEDP